MAPADLLSPWIPERYGLSQIGRLAGHLKTSISDATEQRTLALVTNPWHYIPISDRDLEIADELGITLSDLPIPPNP